uniref:Cytochrome b n=5 Tax=Rhizophagus TaxID=1129544 RepID=I6XFI3_9GLOM|nr:apocytochrome b [Rhizophagus intraradices]YP_003875532.1 apocytochrome b [Rhizophagus irregularis]AJK91346.1 apocytochrome b [Rhizophagus aggregatus]ACM44996.1 apocytochrome b [Rhizophagus intraradices]ADM94787.1 apocytochrome b [Rhizophagus irregularis]AFN42440.1 apocytochrome b [Rhizophagus irregularis]AFN42501.1 apocytochrome b [Rhizophagus irregularis]
MKLVKRHPLIALVNNYLIDSPAPSNLSYIWNFGSLLGTCLALQIITGVTLAMHYIGSVDLAFSSVEHIMRDVNSGWLIRYLHSNGAAFFFIFVYIHMAKALYYGSFRAPRILLWSIGVVIFLVMIITAFLGYVLPWGQMSYWGATVITNLLSAIPWIGTDLVEFIWGGFSVSNATLTRFFSLHFLLPFVLAALAFMHLIALHQNASNNPMGVSSKMDRVPFYPYYVFKDIVGFFVFFLILSIFVFFFPNALGHPDNSIPANPMQTPISIVPEFYLLPFYAILRAIPNKLLGVVAMLAAIFILFLLPYLESSRVRSSAFRPFMRIFFWLFAVNFLLLMWIGANHPEPPFILLGQLCTAFYFAYFLILVPLIGLIENTLSDLGTINPSKNTPQGT